MSEDSAAPGRLCGILAKVVGPDGRRPPDDSSWARSPLMWFFTWRGVDIAARDGSQVITPGIAGERERFSRT